MIWISVSERLFSLNSGVVTHSLAHSFWNTCGITLKGGLIPLVLQCYWMVRSSIISRPCYGAAVIVHKAIVIESLRTPAISQESLPSDFWKKRCEGLFIWRLLVTIKKLRHYLLRIMITLTLRALFSSAHETQSLQLTIIPRRKCVPNDEFGIFSLHLYFESFKFK